ncbi:MAG: hypothetical protein NPMRTH1_400005 [Nitrosopumilales archaeon]|nr:MAG: hypothetical protein NPMRTH1_400005 [Nitrosopumilales archaeon]
MINLEKMDEILAVDDVVRYVSIVDSKGNTINSRMKKNSTDISQDEEREYAMDLCITKQMLDVFNGPFGRTISLQTTREKTRQLIYYHDYLIIYITCDPRANNKKISEISSKIEHLVHEMVSSPQHDLEIKQKSV